MARGATPGWLVAAAVLQAGTYLAQVGMWRRVLVAQDAPLPVADIVPLALAKQFTDQMLPAGFTGSLLAVRGLNRRGTPWGAAAAAVLVSFVGYYVAYAIAVAGALTALWVRGGLDRAILGAATVFAAVAIAIPTGILWLHRSARRRIPRWLRWMRRVPGASRLRSAIADIPPAAFRNRRLLAETAALALVVFALDTATLSVILRALGGSTDLAAAFTALVLASVTTTIGLTPGGLGTFEAAAVGTLHVFGIPIDRALAAALLLRGFTFWLPILPGALFTRRELGPAPGGARRPSAS
jgi:uncharacterized protein (TIRG00374 family)